MKSFVFGTYYYFSIILLILAGCQSQTVPCGTAISGTNGTIEYKLRQPYTAGEICVWTIRTNSTAFEFIKEVSNFGKNEETFLSIYTFDKDGLVASGVMGQIRTQQILYIRGSLAVVVFTAASRGDEDYEEYDDVESNSMMRSGFRLRYKSTGSSTITGGISIVSSSSTGTFTHSPFSKYASMERNIVVVARNLLTRERISIQEYSVSVQVRNATCVDYQSQPWTKMYRITNASKKPEQISYLFGSFAAPAGPYVADYILISYFGYDYSPYEDFGTIQVYWEIY